MAPKKSKVNKPKVKERLIFSANDLPSPTTDTRKKHNKTAKKALARSSKIENPTNDALPPAFEDPAAPTPPTNPFSVDSSRDLDFDLELRADLPGFLPASCAKVAPSPIESFFPDNDDDVFLPFTDVPMTEFSPKRTLRSSRSTDAKTSETPVVDDATQPPPSSSPGEQQQQQQRVYKKANKRVNKKVKRES